MLYYKIKKNFTIPQAFENWREYREILTKYIIQKVEEQEGKEKEEEEEKNERNQRIRKEGKAPTLMILGAGACNDFDLSLLAKHFSAIVLVDCDKNSMEQAIEKYPLSASEMKKIEIRQESLNGIGEEEYISFCEELKDFVRRREKEITHEEFESYALALVEHFFKESKRSGNYLRCLEENKYDYICCFGLHSQLQAMFSYIYRAFEQNLSPLWKTEDISSSTFTARLVAEDEEFIPKFHDTLLQCAKKKIFMGCEYEKCQEIEFPNLENGEIAIKDLQLIEGAYQGICDLKSRKLDKMEYMLTWPFALQYRICYNLLVEEITI